MLPLAIYHGNLEIIQLLISYNASLSIDDNPQLIRAVIEQISNNNIALIKLLDDNNFNFKELAKLEHVERAIYRSNSKLQAKCDMNNITYCQAADLLHAKLHLSSEMTTLLKRVIR